MRREPGPPGLPDAGPGTGWAVPVLRLVQHVAAVTTVGALLVGPARRCAAASALPAAPRWSPPPPALWAASRRHLRRRGSVRGRRPAAGDGARPELVRAYTEQVATGRALLQTAALAPAVALAAPVAVLASGRVVLLALALAALVPPLRTGHAATASDHDLAVVATSVHVLAVVLWVGGLGALLAQRGRPSLAVAVPRFSALALLCFVAVAASGSVSGWTRLPDLSDVVRHGVRRPAARQGRGPARPRRRRWLHRRRTVTRVVRGAPGAFARLATAEVGLMAVALGAARVRA